MIYDISQRVFGCEVYPGNPSPELTHVHSIEKGDHSNLTAFFMCTHNGTHADAPRHFLTHGKSIDEVDIRRFVGWAYVHTHNGTVTARDAREIVKNAALEREGTQKKILFRGEAVVSVEAARLFADEGVELLGCEAQTFGPNNARGEVHRILLEAETVLLEGIRLSEVADGAYFLNCAPLNLNGAEGAPCRAILLDSSEMLN